mmetsp:Transcript_25402/g.37442  ORF Transcript_25402/g.37442 Transcript_25402/m.37442 type:complete len:94 (-) Transcript_25402:224-505(-)
MSADAESDKMMCCASCGTPEVDDVKLKIAPLANSFDIAASNVRRIIGRSINETARREWLNYVTKFYSSNRKAAISVTAPSVVCRDRLIKKNLL